MFPACVSCFGPFATATPLHVCVNDWINILVRVCSVGAASLACAISSNISLCFKRKSSKREPELFTANLSVEEQVSYDRGSDSAEGWFGILVFWWLEYHEHCSISLCAFLQSVQRSQSFWSSDLLWLSVHGNYVLQTVSRWSVGCQFSHSGLWLQISAMELKIPPDLMTMSP